jgi:hypothetical protein
MAIKEPDRNGHHVAFAQRIDRVRDRRRIERLEHAPVECDALAHDDAIRACRERSRPLHVQIVDGAAILPPDLDEVAKAVRRHERNARQLQMHLAK